MSGPQNALAQWLGGGLKTVMLPSGAIFAFRVPDPEDLVAKGLLPEDLRREALQFAASAVDPGTMDTESLAKLLRLMRGMVAQSLRSIWTGPIEPIDAWAEYEAGEHWQAVTLTAQMLEEAAIDPDDYAALQGIVSRQFTARGITAMSMVERGLIERGQGDQIMAEENAKTVPGWKSFRDGRRGAAAGASGAAVERKAVSSGRRQRSRRGAGTR